MHGWAIALLLCFCAACRRNSLIMSRFDGAAQLDSQKTALSRGGISLGRTLPRSSSTFSIVRRREVIFGNWIG